MAHRIPTLLFGLVLIGLSSASVVPSEALAKKITKAAEPAPSPVTGPVVVPDTGGPADRVPRCFDSVIRYPYPPCY